MAFLNACAPLPYVASRSPLALPAVVAVVPAVVGVAPAVVAVAPAVVAVAAAVVVGAEEVAVLVLLLLHAATNIVRLTATPQSFANLE